jgi:hypothetical protein
VALNLPILPWINFNEVSSTIGGVLWKADITPYDPESLCIYGRES